MWRHIAESNKAQTLAAAIGNRDVVLIGSGSSLFVAQLGELALRRRGINAHALAATEGVIDNVAYRHADVIACSQSGGSSDLLRALDAVAPKRVIVLTNTPDSPLGRRADVCIDVGSGPELAIPASKSVTSTAAILLWAADLLSAGATRTQQSLTETAGDVRAWIERDGLDELREAARRISRRRSVIIAGSGYGVPVAYEFALKLKEASYVHAEGFAAGEFRHGSSAILDSGTAMIGIADESTRDVVRRALSDARKSESLRYVIGARFTDTPALGPTVDGTFNVLVWLVVGQLLALYLGRERGVESDAPRGLVKAII